MPTIDPVADNEIIETAWGNAVASELNTQCLKKTGGTMTGAIVLPGSDPTAANHAARKAYVDAQVGAKLGPSGGTLTGPLEWGGNPSSSSPALTIGAGNAGPARIFSSINDAVGPNIRLKHITSASNAYIAFDVGATTVGSIIRNGTNNGVIYQTTSDGRYKHVDADVDPDDAATTVQALHPVVYRWKMGSDGSYDETAAPSGDAQVGLIAQEVADHIPAAVAPPSEENPVWGLDYGRLTPHLVAALQAALARIDALTARVAALEGAG